MSKLQYSFSHFIIIYCIKSFTDIEVQALVNSAQALWVLFFFIVLGVILFSSAVYYMERLGCPIWSKEEERDEDEQNRVLRYEEECEASNTGYSDSGDLYEFVHYTKISFVSTFYHRPAIIGVKIFKFKM